MNEPRHLAKRAMFVAIRLAVAVSATGGITFLCFRLLPVNATTAGFCFLVEVLIIATVWGLIEAMVTSLVAMLCFNFFFFPPVGTLTIAEHNCAMHAVAEQFPEVCDTELGFLRDLLGPDLERRSHIVRGCNACEYTINVVQPPKRADDAPVEPL